MMLLISFWYKIAPKTPFSMFSARSPGLSRLPKHYHSWLIGIDRVSPFLSIGVDYIEHALQLIRRACYQRKIICIHWGSAKDALVVCPKVRCWQYIQKLVHKYAVQKRGQHSTLPHSLLDAEGLGFLAIPDDWACSKAVPVIDEMPQVSLDSILVEFHQKAFVPNSVEGLANV